MSSIMSIFGGGKKKDPAPAPVAPVEDRVTKQEGIEGTTTSLKKRAANSSGTNLVSGRTGSATRGGINIPGK